MTNNNDDGPGSLRQLIAESPVGTVIKFLPALSGETIVLASSELFISKDLTIDASDLQEPITIDANGTETNHRVLQIGENVTATFDSLIIKGGKTPDALDGGTNSAERGGGILSLGDLTLRDCVITENKTGDGGNGTASHPGGAGGAGGGIYCAGMLTMEDCQVTHNETGDAGTNVTFSSAGAGSGGGIWASECIISHSEISYNSTGDSQPLQSTSGGFGGGLYVDRATISDSVISFNLADKGSSAGRGSLGGGIFGVYISMSNCLISNNECGNTATGNTAGGGIYAVFELEMTTTTITNNHAKGPASSAGGLYNNGVATIDHCTISRNKGGGSSIGGGAGVFSGSRANLTMTNCTIAENITGDGDPDDTSVVGGNGGGMIIDGTAHIIHSTIANNRTGVGGKGGGIGYTTSGRRNQSLKLENSIVANNLSSDGGNDIFSPPNKTTIEGNLLISDLSDSSLSLNEQIFVTPHFLGPLGNYGGKTEIMPPLPGSPVINAATSSDLLVDQLDRPRPTGSLPDLGSVEALPLSLQSIVDEDNDTLDDRIEHSIFGNLETASEQSDFDGDGSSDRDEILNMTDPLDPKDYLRIVSFSFVSHSINGHPLFDLTWSSFPGLSYTLQGDLDLKFSDQVEEIATITADGFTHTLQIEATQNPLFLRVLRK